MIELKTCCVCKVEKSLSEFWKRKESKDGLQFACKVCTSQRKKIESRSAESKEARRIWIEKNRDKVNQYSRNWAGKNKEKSTKWQREHPEYQREQTRKDIAELSNKYIKSQLRGCVATSELIEAKRLHIQILRKLKELKA